MVLTLHLEACSVSQIDPGAMYISPRLLRVKKQRGQEGVSLAGALQP